MRTQIIMQILIAVVGLGGAIAGYIKLPNKYRFIMPTILVCVVIAFSILLWLKH